MGVIEDLKRKVDFPEIRKAHVQAEAEEKGVKGRLSKSGLSLSGGSLADLLGAAKEIEGSQTRLINRVLKDG